ncbi:MAG: carbon-nitrogen hydrolase family protein [Alphaproteobacteria bacterium]|nr:carbon-nitrogen hydrolase family protein [Alphaproteobacteria bacterium]
MVASSFDNRPHSDKFLAALVQMSATNQMAENIACAEELIRAAAVSGADMVLTPEMTTLMESDRGALLDKIFIEEEDPGLPVFTALAQELGIWLVIGSMAIKKPAGRAVNRSYLLSPAGHIVTRYDKIHMFDVDLPDGVHYRESRSYSPGKQAVLAATPWGKLGLSICYDLRFPGLYRTLSRAGAMMLSVPAAFTAVTGKAHWHILLRARAIENGSFVMAPAQTGSHISAGGGIRKTYGHSLFVDPWGNIIDDGGVDVGITMAEIDVNLVNKARLRIPSLTHDLPFGLED